MTDTPTLTLLLDKVEALIDCGAGKSTELAKYLGKTRQQVYDWIRVRKFRPEAETTFRIQSWAAAKTLLTSKDRRLGAAYRKAFAEVKSRQRERERLTNLEATL